MKMVTLPQVAEINPSADKDFLPAEDGLVSFVGMASVGENGIIDLSAKRPFSEVSKGYTQFQKGDVLLAKITPCMENGKATLVTDEVTRIGYGSTEFHVLRAKYEVLPEYLFHLIWNDQFRRLAARNMTGSAGQKRVPKAFLEHHKILLPMKNGKPDLTEQKRIAGILDKADAIRRKRQQALQLTDDFLRSLFQDMFGDPVTNPKGWILKPLSDFVERLDGGKNMAEANEETDFRVLKVSAVTYGEYRPEQSKPVPKSFEIPESYFVKKGDLLISRANTRELIGATAYVWDTPDNIILPDKIWKFIWKKDELINPFFVHAVTKSGSIRHEMGRRASGTSGSMKNIAKPKLLSLQIPVPPIELQNHFADCVVQQRKLQIKSISLKREAYNLFSSLQKSAFKGVL
jgi:type I restriction enzyme S subunit